MAKMTMAEWEKSPKDKKIDKANGYKEGSAVDKKHDKAELAKVNKNKKANKMACKTCGKMACKHKSGSKVGGKEMLKRAMKKIK